jgi:hypothetical protein
MDRVCCICDRPIKQVVGLRKCDDGLICNDCYNYFPSVAIIKDYRSHTIRSIVNYEKQCAKDFVCTSHIGNIYIDEMHNLIAYSKKASKDLTEPCNIFKITDLKSIEISVTEPRVNGKMLYCDMLLTVSVEKFPIAFQKVLKKNLVCNYQRVDSQRVTYEMPSEYIATKTLVNKLIHQCCNNAKSELEVLKQLRTMKEQEIERIKSLEESKIKKSGGIKKVRAEATLFLEENYTSDELKKNYRQLARVLHPDLNKISEKYIQKLNSAFETLSKDDTS